jgi:hypothetical protein
MPAKRRENFHLEDLCFNAYISTLAYEIKPFPSDFLNGALFYWFYLAKSVVDSLLPHPFSIPLGALDRNKTQRPPHGITRAAACCWKYQPHCCQRDSAPASPVMDGPLHVIGAFELAPVRLIHSPYAMALC